MKLLSTTTPLWWDVVVVCAHLRLAEVEVLGEDGPLGADDVLLLEELRLQPLQLLRREDGPRALLPPPVWIGYVLSQLVSKFKAFSPPSVKMELMVKWLFIFGGWSSRAKMQLLLGVPLRVSGARHWLLSLGSAYLSPARAAL